METHFICIYCLNYFIRVRLTYKKLYKFTVYSLMNLEIICFHETITMVCTINISIPPRFCSHPLNLLLVLLLLFLITIYIYIVITTTSIIYNKTLNRYKSNSIHLETLSFQIRLESCLNNRKCECQVQDCFKRLAVPANIEGTTCHSCKPALVYSGSCRARLGGRNP